MKEVSLEDILYTIATWNIEAGCGHNDGFTRENYLSKIYKVEEEINRLKEPKVIT